MLVDTQLVKIDNISTPPLNPQMEFRSVVAMLSHDVLYFILISWSVDTFDDYKRDSN